MIYRKWSLLTGPVAILGGVVATVAAANFIFVKDVISFLAISFLTPPFSAVNSPRFRFVKKEWS